jgi:DNA mismatch endonuclease (patch repair protein)
VSARPFKRVERRLAGRRVLHTDATASARMARVRRAGTAPELVVRRAASLAGLRYTVSNKDLPGSPDLANRTRRIAVFVHGCYWHHHGGRCVKSTVPKSNRAFWLAKFAWNRARDRATRRALTRMGFTVVVIWECQVADPGRLSRQLARALPG